MENRMLPTIIAFARAGVILTKVGEEFFFLLCFLSLLLDTHVQNITEKKKEKNDFVVKTSINEVLANHFCQSCNLLVLSDCRRR